MHQAAAEISLQHAVTGSLPRIQPQRAATVEQEVSAVDAIVARIRAGADERTAVPVGVIPPSSRAVAPIRMQISPRRDLIKSFTVETANFDGLG